MLTCFFVLQDGRSALHCAAAIGHLVLVKQLLDSGAPINALDMVRKLDSDHLSGDPIDLPGTYFLYLLSFSSSKRIL